LSALRQLNFQILDGRDVGKAVSIKWRGRESPVLAQIINTIASRNTVGLNCLGRSLNQWFDGSTVDAGTVKVLYVIQPDAQGHWHIDVELDRPADPACVAFRADSLARMPIAKPDEEYPFQTLGFWPPDKLPKELLSDSEVKDAKLYRVILVRGNKPASDPI
jgi:hypothetical protein